MNEQQNQSYIKLIQKLINCANKWEVNEIIRDNFDYVDVDFLRMLLQEAVRLQQGGNFDNADFLRDIVNQLADFLGIEEEDLKVAEVEPNKSPLKRKTAETNNIGKYKTVNISDQMSGNEQQLVFLNEVLEQIIESKRNLKQFDESLIQTINNWANIFLSQQSGATAQRYAKLICDFATLINQFPLGDKALNLEIGITCYQAALQAYQQDQFPQEWASTQNNLAIAYTDRIKGDKSDNIEKAISAAKKALQIRTKEKFPVEWAMTQHNLANAYSNRIKRDKADNLEQAIAASEKALQIYTKEAFPYEWSTTQNNLAGVYYFRIKGDKADNLEKAISAFEEALQILTKEALPVEWAMTQNNLAGAYSNRIKGDKADNLEKAIQSYRNSLQIYTAEDLPFECLQNSRNLGDLGFKEGNWKVAIEGYSIAIEAVENSRSEAISEIRRQEIMAEAIGVYQNIIQSHINLGQIDKAIEYAEQSHLSQVKAKYILSRYG